MPVDALAQQLLLRQPKPIGTPIPLPETDPNPTMAKSAFEGGIDTLLGALGVGPETKSNQVGQLLMAGAPIAGGIRGVPGLYSRLTKAAEEMPSTMTASGARSYLMNRAPKEEMDWRSALTTLNGKNPSEKVTRDEILKHLNQNPLDLEVKTLGEPYNQRYWDLYKRYIQGEGPKLSKAEVEEFNALDEPHGHSSQSAQGTTPPTKYSNYTLPGGKNYRETLIKLARPDLNTARVEEIGNQLKTLYSHPDYGAGVPESHNLARQAQALQDERDQLRFGKVYQSSHWDDPNILVHVRHNESNLPYEGTVRTPQEIGDLLAKDIGAKDSYVLGSGILDRGVRTGLISPQEAHTFGSSRGFTNANEFPKPEGAKGRFLEEVQSDWHEQGRDNGYKDPAAIERLNKEREQAINGFNNEVENLRNVILKTGMYPNVAKHEPYAVMDTARYGYEFKDIPEVKEALYKAQDAQGLFTRINEKLNDATSISKVPNAPFKESWPDLALKQQLLDVANRPDLDWLGFTPASVQNDRYNLASHVSKLAFEHDPVSGKGMLYAWGPDGTNVLTQTLQKPEDMIPHIGKDAASRLTSQEPKVERLPNFEYGDYHPTHTYELTGQQLEVGGEGMKKFYDEMLPRKLEKLLKPFGGKVEQIQAPWGKTPQVDVRNHRQPSMQIGGVPHYTGDITVGSDHVASTWPPLPRQPGVVPEVRGRADDLAHEIAQGIKAEKVNAWVAKLTPEMKERIRKEGLPLLLLLIAQHFNTPTHNPKPSGTQ